MQDNRQIRKNGRTLILGGTAYRLEALEGMGGSAIVYRASYPDSLSPGERHQVFIKELFPIAMAGTSTAALNLFPFAGGAILTTIAGFIVVDKTLAEYQTLWMIAFILMVIGCICAFLSMEKADVEKAEAKKAPAPEE